MSLANGEEVEYYKHEWMDVNRLSVRDLTSSDNMYKFRLKPHTITINGIEVPAPFKPKEGDLYWHTSPEYMIGYGASMYSDGNVDTWQQFGAWRNEEEIKQVVSALRSVFKTI